MQCKVLITAVETTTLTRHLMQTHNLPKKKEKQQIRTDT